MRGFPKEEFINRIAKLRQLMEKNQVDAIIITSPSNFRYFTGLDSYFWESPTRPWFVLIPLLKDPIAIVPSIGLSSLEKTWIENILTWDSPNPEDEGISTVLNAIHSLKIEKGNITETKDTPFELKTDHTQDHVEFQYVVHQKLYSD